jgi:hypothetical protein
MKHDESFITFFLKVKITFFGLEFSPSRLSSSSLDAKITSLMKVRINKLLGINQ